MNIDQGNKLNQLLQNWHPGTLLFSTWLNKNGYSAQLMQQYRKSGWFSLLSKGVLYRTGDKFSAYAALSGLRTQLNKSFYVGVHSALELFGFNNYVPMGKPILMVGHSKEDKVLKWMTETDFEFEMKLFITETFANPQLTVIKENNSELLTSVPEQAFLECLLLAPS